MGKRDYESAKELYFKIISFRYENEEDYINFINYNIPNDLIYKWESEKRAEKYCKIYDCLSKYNGDLNDAMNIWSKIKTYDEFQYYWEIRDYLNVLDEMDKKRVWEVPFTIGMLDFRESNLPDKLYIRNYFLCDSKSNYNNLREKKLYAHNGFSGLLSRCSYMLNYQPLIYKDMVAQLIKLIIHGISVGGIQCIDLAMDLFNFIKTKLLLEPSIKNEYIKMLKDSYPLPDEAFENSKRINSMKSYFQFCHSSIIDGLLYNFTVNINSILCSVKNNEINDNDATLLISSEIINCLLQFLENTSYEYFELYKIYYLVTNDYFYLISYKYIDNEREKYIKILNNLIGINDKNNKFYTVGKDYCGLIPYCFYKGYRHICFLLIKEGLLLINYYKKSQREIDLFEKFYSLLVHFINETNNNNFKYLLKKTNYNII